MTDSQRRFGFTTRQLHAGQTVDTTTGCRAVLLYQTTTNVEYCLTMAV